jgi:hypothetical protein
MYANPRATIAIVPANLRKLKHVARVSTARRKISQSSEKLSASPHLSSRLAYHHRDNVCFAVSAKFDPPPLASWLLTRMPQRLASF